MTTRTQTANAPQPLRILVTGATGKTGRRVASRLSEAGHAVRLGSRLATPAFDWNAPDSWAAALEGMDAVYIAYSPDLAAPGATQTIADFVQHARQSGVKRLVVLSGRGEAEAQACERLVLDSGLQASVVRASWFAQNFSEGEFVHMVQAGCITLPQGEAPEPFVDVDDIADVAVAALTEDGHDGEIYEVTGPRLLHMSDVAALLSEATGRDIRFEPVPHADFVAGVKASGAPEQIVWLMDYLFSVVLDGRNSYVSDGVERALGRPPRDFAVYARQAAATGVWSV